MASSADDRMIAAYDNTLLGILQNEGRLESFLDIIFGFLCRKTDFYLTMTSPTQRYGFPPGVAEKMILTYFKKYHNAVQTAESKRQISATQKPAETASLYEETESGHKKSIVTAKIEEVHEQAPPSSAVTSEEKSEESVSKKNTLDIAKERSPSDDEPPSASDEMKNTEEKQEKTGTEEENNQTVFQSNPDSYNGAMRDKYSWSQNYDDVDVKIPVEKSVLRAKQVVIDIQRKHLKVQVKMTEKSEFETVIDDDMQHEVNREDSMWSLEPGKHIDITLTKDKNIWWTTLVLGEDEIDIQKICPERSMADMEEEERAVINKLKFDDHQKKLGLPQSHELKVHEMLKKGWDAEGSPFQGQDFDPKMFNISPGAVDH